MSNYKITIAFLLDEGDDPREVVVASLEDAVQLVLEHEPPHQEKRIREELLNWVDGDLDGEEYTYTQVYVELTDEPVTPPEETARDKALFIAFGTFASNRDEVVAGVGIDEVMEDAEQWEKHVQVWQPFEGYETDDVREFIENLAHEIQEALES